MNVGNPVNNKVSKSVKSTIWELKMKLLNPAIWKYTHNPQITAIQRLINNSIRWRIN